ncbi:Uncharacterized protein dnm_016530 [Desulfonema magnum]|uniref:Uncharacterized protein n=1 Tax=Desulfonema magnum TaxID=45655 RepID=A0A975BHJ4_9BACT|nr:Uncharacterized protein dnm_016530 [Desulfonema magnum]
MFFMILSRLKKFAVPLSGGRRGLYLQRPPKGGTTNEA